MNYFPHHPHQRHRFHAFTLIELLVVIAIIGLLASIVILQVSIGRMRARDAQRISDIHSIQQALALDYNVKDSYISSSENASPPVAGLDCGNQNIYNFCSSANQIVDGHWIYNRSGRNLAAYLPKDPIPPSRNTYDLPFGAYYYYALDTHATDNGGSQFYMLVYNTESTPGGKQTGAFIKSGFWAELFPNGITFNLALGYDNDYIFTVGKTGE